MIIVLDTNVLISGVINPSGIPSQIVSLFLNASIHLSVDTRILAEYSDVLYREKFGFKPELIEYLLEYIHKEGIIITAEPINTKFTDEDDKKFYEVMIAAEADYLVTGNLNHFPEENRIVSPKSFIEMYFTIMDYNKTE